MRTEEDGYARYQDFERFLHDRYITYFKKHWERLKARLFGKYRLGWSCIEKTTSPGSGETAMGVTLIDSENVQICEKMIRKKSPRSIP